MLAANKEEINARVVELVYTLDLKSGGASLAGSNPASRTKIFRCKLKV